MEKCITEDYGLLFFQGNAEEVFGRNDECEVQEAIMGVLTL
jgi:hypothetical protein